METWLQITGILLSLTGLVYTGLIVFFTFGWYRKKTVQKALTGEPMMKVSVIVAARNEESRIGKLLGDLAAQQYPSSLMEVMVIDDHSTDKTAEVVTDFIAKHDLSGFILINNDDREGKKAALAKGIGKSTGELILSTDADCHVGTRWIAAMAAFFQDKAKVMVSGPVSYFPEKGPLNRFQSLEFAGLMASGAGAAMAGHPFMCNGANLAFRKRAFMKVDGYAGNEKFISGDDVFLMHKMKKEFGNSAICFTTDSEALVKTYPAPGLRAFFNQRIRWASKTRGYRDRLSILTAGAVFSFNLVIAATFFAAFCCPVFILLFAGAIFIKSIIDLTLMLGVTGFYHQKEQMFWYLPFQVMYPFYVLVAGVWSLFERKKW
jgi:cellulose synthase/poly-beta-1,6-N-acetylglucosamine synthase-like glycosyltransferase